MSGQELPLLSAFLATAGILVRTDSVSEVVRCVRGDRFTISSVVLTCRVNKQPVEALGIRVLHEIPESGLEHSIENAAVVDLLEVLDLGRAMKSVINAAEDASKLEGVDTEFRFATSTGVSVALFHNGYGHQAYFNVNVRVGRGTIVSIEDLAALFSAVEKSAKRLLKRLKAQGVALPTDD